MSFSTQQIGFSDILANRKQFHKVFFNFIHSAESHYLNVNDKRKEIIRVFSVHEHSDAGRDQNDEAVADLIVHPDNVSIELHGIVVT